MIAPQICFNVFFHTSICSTKHRCRPQTTIWLRPKPHPSATRHISPEPTTEPWQFWYSSYIGQYAELFHHVDSATLILIRHCSFSGWENTAHWIQLADVVWWIYENEPVLGIDPKSPDPKSSRLSTTPQRSLHISFNVRLNRSGTLYA